MYEKHFHLLERPVLLLDLVVDRSAMLSGAGVSHRL
jgi:hypothetical protein